MEGKVSEEATPDLIPWTVGDIAKGVAVVIGFLFLLVILTVVAAVVIAISMLGVEELAELGPEGLEQFLTSADFLQRLVIAGLVTSFALQGVIFFTAWLFSVSKYRSGWRALGFRSFSMKRALLLVLVVLGIGVLVNVLYELLIVNLGMEPPPAVPPEFIQSGLSLAMLSLLAVLVAPFAEEIFFRGFIFSGIGNRYGYGWGAILSALIFALVHVLTLWQVGVLVPVFLLGLLLAWLYIRTHSIWPCIFTHFAYNSLALLFVI
ncbi:MAG: lysostaphin resistance A-like protein [Dehalococcoidia bacterium]